MATSADVMGALFLYALVITSPKLILLAHREDFRLSEKATVTTLSGMKHPMKRSQFEKILDEVPVESDGRIRLNGESSMSGRISDLSGTSSYATMIRMT